MKKSNTVTPFTQTLTILERQNSLPVGRSGAYNTAAAILKHVVSTPSEGKKAYMAIARAAKRDHLPNPYAVARRSLRAWQRDELRVR